MYGSGDTRLNGLHERPGVLKFPSTHDADLVRPSLNCEHAAQLAVVTAPNSEPIVFIAASALEARTTTVISPEMLL
jgi:hypothetical protein